MPKVQNKTLKKPAAAGIKRNSAAATWIRLPPSFAPEKQKWVTAVGGAHLPDWAGHYCNLLAGHFAKLADMTQSKQLTINIWADCGGMYVCIYIYMYVCMYVRICMYVHFYLPPNKQTCLLVQQFVQPSM